MNQRRKHCHWGFATLTVYVVYFYPTGGRVLSHLSDRKHGNKKSVKIRAYLGVCVDHCGLHPKRSELLPRHAFLCQPESGARATVTAEQASLVVNVWGGWCSFRDNRLFLDAD